MARAGLRMAGLALVTIALSMLIPLIGWFVLAPITAIAIGAGAAWWASKLLGYGTAGRGAAAGALAGLGALIGSPIGLITLFSISLNNPAGQAQLDQILRTIQQQNPDQALPNTVNAGAAATVTGLIVGLFCFGLVYFFLSLISGLIAGIIYGRNPGGIATAPAAVYPGTASAAGIPQMTNTVAPPTMTPPAPPAETEQDRAARIYPDTDQEGGARVYPDNEQR